MIQSVHLRTRPRGPEPPSARYVRETDHCSKLGNICPMAVDKIKTKVKDSRQIGAKTGLRRPCFFVDVKKSSGTMRADF